MQHGLQQNTHLDAVYLMQHDANTANLMQPPRPQPEPREFLQSKEGMTLQRAATLTARRVAASFVKQASNDSASDAQGRAAGHALGVKQLSSRLESLTELVLGADVEDAAAEKAVAGDNVVMTAVAEQMAVTSSTAAAARPEVRQVVSLPRTAGTGRNTARAVLRVYSLPQQPTSAEVEGGSSGEDSSPGSMDAAVAACQTTYVEELQKAAAATKHHAPLLVLFRKYWRQCLLYIMLEGIASELSPRHMHCDVPDEVVRRSAYQYTALCSFSLLRIDSQGNNRLLCTFVIVGLCLFVLFVCPYPICIYPANVFWYITARTCHHRRQYILHLCQLAAGLSA